MVASSIAHEGKLTGSTLIKSLKASSDPPVSGGPRKIELAASAWRHTDLVVPRKADVIRDWILEAWSRAKPGKANPIVDPAYHRLLVEVTPSCASPAAAPLSLLSTYIGSCKVSDEVDSTLSTAVESSLRVLFQETKAEAWAEVWGTLVAALATCSASAAGALQPVAQSVTAALSASLPTSPNAKKIAQSLHASLPAYSKALYAHPEFEHTFGPLAPQLFFPIPTLQTIDPIKLLIAPLSTSAAEDDLRPALALLPHLFDAFIASTLKNKYALYGKSSSDRPVDVIVADRVRNAVIPALGACLDLANRVEDSGASVNDAIWDARLRLWQRLVAWGGYLETEEKAGNLVISEAKRAARALQEYGASEAHVTDEGLASKILRTLDALERLDHTRAAIDTMVVGWCLASPARTHAAARALLMSVLRFHQLTHSLGSFFDLLCDAVTGLFDSALPSAALAAVYTLVAAGPLADKAFQDDLGAAVRSTNLAGRRSAQWAALLDDIGRRVRTALAGKRKRTEDAPARLVAVLSRLAGVVLAAGSRARAGDDEVEGAIGASARAFVEEEGETKKKRKSNDADDLVEAARLRVARSARLVRTEETVESVPASLAISASTGSPELRLEAFRFLLTHLALTAHSDHEDRSSAVTAVIDLLASPGLEAWTGRVATVASPSLPAAGWTILAQQGMAVLDATADTTQLDRLASLIVSLASDDIMPFSTSTAIRRILSTAETWELVAFRTALLRALTPGKSVPAGTFAVLSACPASWLSKGARNALLEAAYAVDAGSDTTQRAPIRTWLARLASSGIMGPLDVTGLTRVLSHAEGAEEATLALARPAYVHFIRDPASLEGILDAAVHALKKQAKKDKKGEKVSSGDVRVPAVPLLLAALTSQPLDKFACREKLDTLEVTFRATLAPRVEVALEDISAPAALDTLKAYHSLTIFSRWLGKGATSDIGARLLSSLLVTPVPSLAAITLDLVPRNATLAAFLLLSTHSNLDDAFKAHARTLSVDEYTAALTSLIARASDSQPLAASTALRAARILVSAPVEGSGRAIASVLQSLLAAADAAVHVPDTRVVEEGLSLIGSLVDDRTGLLRTHDAAQILATITSALLPSSSTTTSSAPHIFTLAISPLLTLSRHRADLILAHMPSMVGALAAAIPLLQTPHSRARAGRNRLASKRPFWLSSENDLPSNEAAGILSRTLVALSTARLPTQNDAPSRALAGPLGKHAPAILVAYARAAADPWAGISPSTRKALEPGLFAMCDIVTAGGRADGRGREGEGIGAPFGLDRDDAEREVWAELWRAWGRRRYTGQG